MTDSPRGAQLARALKLEYLTLVWNSLEGLIAVIAALSAGSIALLAFGVDSFVECASGGILIWRLRAEATAADRCAIAALDRRAHKLVGASLFLLALYISADSGHALYACERPHPTVVGLALTGVSMGVMAFLARAKRRVAVELGSRAMEADSFQTSACFWLSAVTLVGIGLNAVLGWWWADPVAALAMTVFLVQEGREAWRGEDCCG